MTPQLSFIIINWNGGELLKRCIDSIARYPPSISCDVIVVDNASTDASIAWLRECGGHAGSKQIPLRVIENSDNRGFGKANNQAFALTEAPLLFLLNADAELTKDACDTLISTLNSSADIGACGPRLLNPDGSLQISVWRNPPTAWATLVSGLRLASLLPKRLRGELLLAEHWDHSRRRDVGMFGGAAILVRRAVVDEVGGFDERFHMYGEDNEWCLRIKRAGWRLVFEPDARVVHQGAHGARQRWTDLEKLHLQTEAYLQFLHQAVPRRGVIANLTASSTLLALQRTLRRIRSRPVEEVDTVLRLHFRDLKRALGFRSSATRSTP
jgi:N-acetylglucosaminyl-diphospho-decaprenol L-rhamnosyltransferase